MVAGEESAKDAVCVSKVSSVTPATPTTRRIMFLTSCDLVCRSYPYINRLFFFKALHSHASSFEAMVSLMQEGLSRALVLFFPLAGRFCYDAEDRLQIDCAGDEGVEFVEASCELPFSVLLQDGFQHRSLFWKLARRTHYLRCDYLHEPILSVQVTKFADGGYTVGVSMSHAAADAQSFYDFVNCWGETCRNVAMTVAPRHMRLALSVKALFPAEEFPKVESNAGCYKSECNKKEATNGCLKCESTDEEEECLKYVKEEATNGCLKSESNKKQEANGCLTKNEATNGCLKSEINKKEGANGCLVTSESTKEEPNGYANGDHAGPNQRHYIEENIALSTHEYPHQLDELVSTLTASKEHQNGNIVVDEHQNGNDLVKQLRQMRLGLIRQNGKVPSRGQAPVMEKQMKNEEHRRPRSDLVQKIFSFSMETLQRLKERANAGMPPNGITKSEVHLSNGSTRGNSCGVESRPYTFTTFEAFCAHWWQCLIGARRLPPAQPVFLLIPINCRQRFLGLPKAYFGNALDGGLVRLTAGELCEAEAGTIAGKIHEAIMAATEESFTQYIKEAEKRRNAIPHFDRTGLFHVVDSPKYPVYNIDFGFGTPEAVRAEGFRFGAEVQILAGRLGPGSYDLFCALDSDTMDTLEHNPAFLAS